MMPGRPMTPLTHDRFENDLDRLLAPANKSTPEWGHFLQRLLGDATCRQLGLYPIPTSFKLSVVIPVYNEQRWIRELVRRVEAVPITKEILIVDDYSTDGTRDLLRELESHEDV